MSSDARSEWRRLAYEPPMRRQRQHEVSVPDVAVARDVDLVAARPAQPRARRRQHDQGVLGAQLQTISPGPRHHRCRQDRAPSSHQSGSANAAALPITHNR
jgi:hypothetical protein